MTTIALTGGIASGKTTIANRLRELGAVILDADQYAREIVAPGSKALREIHEHFGDGVMNDDGTLNRAALAAIVFTNEEERQVLNGITHPEITRLTQERFEAARAEDPECIIVHDIPLLAESRHNYDYDEIWVADAPADVRAHRLVVERGMDPAEARGRIDAQISDERRRALADVLIDTTLSIEETLAQVDELWKQLQAGKQAQAAEESYGS